MTKADIRVLVVDDSAANRRAITQLLESAPGLTVVDRAGDGEDGLKKALLHRPDVITLDLEMPKLDGFSFLRLLMARAPTPVIVLSSYGHPSDVFKAMQLGAVDFVAKPQGADATQLEEVRAELVQKIRGLFTGRRPDPRPSPVQRLSPTAAKAARLELPRVPKVLALGASTGGPPAVQRMLEALGPCSGTCVVVAQHMPARFTDAFADRLDHVLQSWRVSEAKDGDALAGGRVLIAPGGAQLEIVARDGQLFAAVTAASPYDRYAPSVDRLFTSLSRHAALTPVAAAVLTGMGNDGAEGTTALAQVGAPVWAEAEETAVVHGMPAAAAATGRVKAVLPLGAMGSALASWAR